MRVTCWVQLGWGPRLEDLSEAAAKFCSDQRLRNWFVRGGQLVIREEVDSNRAVRLTWDFGEIVNRSTNLWRAVPILWKSIVIKIPAPWFLVLTGTPAEPPDLYAGCIAIEEPVWRRIGSQLPFSASEERGMYIWRGPDFTPPEPPSSRTETAGDDPIFSPEGEPPDFIEIEER